MVFVAYAALAPLARRRDRAAGVVPAGRFGKLVCARAQPARSAGLIVARPILEAQALTRRFGGLVANDNVTLHLARGELHALLGPNGAGKSTFINLLSGDLAASSGSVVFKGHEITRYRPDRRSRLGIGRSYQRTNIFPRFTVFENCRLAAQSRHPRALAMLAVAYAD